MRFEPARMSDQGIQVDEVHARTVLGAQPAPNIKGIGIAVIVYPNPNEEVIKSLVDQRSAQRMARDRYRVTPNAMKITVDAEPFDSDDAHRCPGLWLQSTKRSQGGLERHD